jgi:hypothetical protein
LAHLGGAGLVPVAHGGIADEAPEFATCQIAGHDFALCEGPGCGGVVDFAAQLHGGYHGLGVIGMGQRMCLDLNRVGRIGGQTDMASAFGPHRRTARCPAEIRRSESGGLRTRQGKFGLEARKSGVSRLGPLFQIADWFITS